MCSSAPLSPYETSIQPGALLVLGDDGYLALLNRNRRE